MSELHGTEVASNVEPTSQVYKVTHDGEGFRLPFMNRSFISFSYGGKYIEDFDLIVVTDGDSRSGTLYAEFQDNVTESDILDENFFWSSHFNGNSLNLTLATDGVTENTIEDFKTWFKPGIKRELILSEHPNRGIQARVSAAPQYNLLPFEKKTKVKIGGRDYDTSTTIYRGTVNITFAMEEPYWYSLSNVLYYKDENDTIEYDRWLSAKGVPSFIYEDKDAAKIILEDNIPINAMLKYPNMFIGSTVTVDASTLPDTQIGIAEIDSGRVGPLFEDFAGVDVPYGSLPTVSNYYFYYAGNAPEKPKLTFTLTPQIKENGIMESPRNIFAQPNSTQPYNHIFLQSTTQREFKFTTPSIWTGYNQAIKIIGAASNNATIQDVHKALRLGVNHPAPRAYAINVACAGNEWNSTKKSDAITIMQNFLKDSDGVNLLSAKFIFDSKTGTAKGFFSYRNTEDLVIDEPEEENVGDMVLSEYLIIQDRNHPENGYIEKYTTAHPDYSHYLHHNVQGGLQSVLLEYTNKYY